MMELIEDSLVQGNRIYISGPITGTNDYFRRFKEAEGIAASLGINVVNPVYNAMVVAPHATHEQYMHICFAEMEICNMILMLDGWESSKGATAEHARAEELGLIILYESDMKGGDKGSESQ